MAKLPSCKRRVMPSFAPSSQIKGLDCSCPLPLGSMGNTHSCNHTGSKPVAGNHRLDANDQASLFGQAEVASA